MLTWVVYDIADDQVRARVAKKCLNFGLYRVQRSVFLGDVEPNRLDEIELFSKAEMDAKTDSLYLFPMCQKDFDRVRIIGLGFDKKLVTGELLTKVI
jgi:CRISPR-associated protein Cas2